MSLIFDIGAHHGLDTAYYLALGHDVVAVEAHPNVAKVLRENLKGKALMIDRTSIGGVAIIEATIADLPHLHSARATRLYSSVNNHGETHSIHPGKVKGIDSVPIEVRVTTVANLLNRYGVPFYFKCDIEGADVVAIRQLHLSGAKPQYISVELDHNEPIDTLEILEHLGRMGYTRFRLVEQSAVGRGEWDHLNEIPGGKFTWGMTGPFGPALFDGRDTTGKALECGIQEMTRRWFSVKPIGGRWYDLHATY